MTTPSAARRALYRDVARARLQHHLPGRSSQITLRRSLLSGARTVDSVDSSRPRCARATGPPDLLVVAPRGEADDVARVGLGQRAAHLSAPQNRRFGRLSPCAPYESATQS